MIVRRLRDRVQLITQPDHAHLSRAIMERCVPLDPLRRDDILHAIGEHDNGWQEEDAAPSVNAATGEIYDFVSAPVDLRQGVWPRAVTRLNNVPWAAALVAQHAITVYDRFRSDAQWRRFFTNMESLRDAMVSGTGTPLAELMGDYKFVRLGDLISLVFCTGWTDEHSFGGWNVRRSGTRVLVAPDLFGGAVTPVEITAKEIRNQPYRSNAELRAAVRDAKTVTLRGEVAG
jgi:Protein of unknown function (DUF3891)